MDISSLLAPQDSTAADEALLSRGGSGSGRRTHSSSHTQTSLPTPSVVGAESTPPSNIRGAPLVNGTTTARQNPTTTVGMDTLAELASMQHHQQAARASATGLRSAELIDPRQLPAMGFQSMQACSHNTKRKCTPCSSLDITMTDAPSSEQARPRAACVSEEDQQTIAELITYLKSNLYAYESYVQLINLLHQGFISHVHPPATTTHDDTPSSFELLAELRWARELMAERFAAGEEIWVDWISDESMLANTLEENIDVIELCKKAVEDEAGSTRLWLLYGNWMRILYDAAHFGNKESLSGAQVKGTKPWTEEEREMGKELFSWENMLDIWKQGVRATRWRINDSYQVWNEYASSLLDDLKMAPSTAKIENIRAAFTDRLQVPHTGWDQTSHEFSMFITNYDNASYEETMVRANSLAKSAKEKYAMREMYELEVIRAIKSADRDAEWIAFTRYLEWETGQSRKKTDLQLCCALYERLLSRFGVEATLWEEYVYFILEKRVDIGPNAVSLLEILKRATRHCPWSGGLWSQFLLSLERAGKPFQEVEAIKHKATQTGLFDIGGWEEVMKVYIAWCGFLKRRAFLEKATDEDLDVAEVGIRSALEGVAELGKRKQGKDYHGDPRFRLESIYIQYLSEKGLWEEAREVWKDLVKDRGDSHTFWLSYYTWEVLCWGRASGAQSAVSANTGRLLPPPSYATGVLQQAVKRPDVDWPEKVQEALLDHVQIHDDAKELQEAVLLVRRMSKVVKKRREQQALEAATLAQSQEPNVSAAATLAAANEEVVSSTKRKRGLETDAGDTSTVKKGRQDTLVQIEQPEVDQKLPATSLMKRDRENTTVIVRNLPASATEAKVRQYFRDCGTINSIKVLLDGDGDSATATIEFESKDDVLAAQTRDMKRFDGNEIEVHIGTGLTLYVTNYPPTADEAYIRDLFKDHGEIVDVRFPSLKFNTHRRFCYVQFKYPSQARNAMKLDGISLGERETLVVKMSDPNRKEDRKGPVHEGREIFVANLDWSATEDELSQIFLKYGTVERARIPRKVNGASKGIGYVVFSSKDEANAALDLHLTKFKSRVLNVALSEPNPTKRQATTIITSEPSLGQANGKHSPPLPHHQESPMADTSTPPPQPSNHTTSSIKEKTLGVMNVPDTVNDARITQLFSAYGQLKRVLLRPDHRGAIVEFENVADAGKAALALEGVEIAPGRKLMIGSVQELMREKAEYRDGKLVPSRLQKSTHVKRPVQQNSAGRGVAGGKRRGGLGFKAGVRGVGNTSSTGGLKETDKDEGSSREKESGNIEARTGKPKSNADFKAMFLKQEH
ncbi:MAG: Splicing factor [Geoglossum umbratile]|nr:MAG: Splicing factor [Geoglossum umbratile]